MLVKTTFLLFAGAFAGINAARRGALASRDLNSGPLAELVPQDLNVRAVNTAGGWSLALPMQDDSQCPLLAPRCGTSWCCPGALACVTIGDENIAEVCCPTNADCTAAFTAVPACADSSWSLWNATGNTDNAASLFCCLQGQVGLQTGYCVDATLAVTAGPPAVILATGVGAVQSGVSATSSTAPAGTSASTSAAGTVSVSASTKASGASTGTVASTTAVSASSKASGSSAATAGSGLTTAAKSSSTATSGTAAATTSAVKAGAVGSHSQRGACLGGVVAAAFAFALL